MIELRFTGMCEDCKCMDLSLQMNQVANGKYRQEVKCSHEWACKRIERRHQTGSEGKDIEKS